MIWILSFKVLGCWDQGSWSISLPQTYQVDFKQALLLFSTYVHTFILNYLSETEQWEVDVWASLKQKGAYDNLASLV